MSKKGGAPYPIQASHPLQPVSTGGYPSAPPSYDESLAHPPAGPQYQSPGGPPLTAATAYPAPGYPQGGYPGQAYLQGYPAPQGYPSYPGYPGCPPQGGYPAPATAYPPGPAPAASGFRQEVLIPGAFEAGARFDGIAQPRIPPPPPGCAPNAAQLAAMNGATVVTSQKKSNQWIGGSGGGWVFW